MKSRNDARVSALVLAILAACSGSDDRPERASDPPSDRELEDPCELLTMEEIESVVDSEVVEAVSGHTAGNRLCVWYDHEGYTVMTLRLDGDLALYRAAAESQTSVPVNGVGDEAYFAGANMVHVKVGTASFFTQSQKAVANGMISQEVAAAAGAEPGNAQAKYEAGYRIAKLVAGRL